MFMKYKMFLSGDLVAALISGFVLGGCSKDEDDPDQGKKSKITISVSDAFSKAEGDHFQFCVGASDSKGASVDWKINGETEKGTVIFITDEDVDGGKSDIVVESVQQLDRKSTL